MRLWLIPMVYVAASVVCGLTLPRLEQAYLASYTFDLSVASAQACLSAVASGMMALTGVVFAMAFVMVQFSAIAYSPRLVLWFARDRVLFHSLGAFAATFIYALFTLAWIDRGASGTVPLFSTLLVAVMLIYSMLLFSRLVQRLTDLQITSVLQLVGDKGREVIREMFRRLDERPAAEWNHGIKSADGVRFGPVSQTLAYSGQPRTIAELNTDALVRQGQRSGAVIVMACAVGDTLVDGSVVLRVHGAKGTLAEKELMRAVHLAAERTFRQDPKYPIRLLVDIAIKALSPAINDPTTAVQAIDQIEDLLRRLAGHDLDAGFAWDSNGVLRLVVPMPTWEDYLALGFDEIRQFGMSSVQVMRRLRAALIGLVESTTVAARAQAVRHYLEHLDLVIERSALDTQDKATALQADPQGLGLSRRAAVAASTPIRSASP
ncbi:MAG TPA: DUF2254 domain-containing protein [Xanthobacteraceae bacterium]|jgi:uncharacterized membrane protein